MKNVLVKYSVNNENRSESFGVFIDESIDKASAVYDAINRATGYAQALREFKWENGHINNVRVELDL